MGIRPLLLDDRGIQLLCGVICHGIVFDFGDALHILDHLRHQFLIRPVFSRGCRTCCLLHDGVKDDVQNNTGCQHQTDPPVKGIHKAGDHQGREDTLCGDHDDPGRDICQGLHGVGRYIGDRAQRIPVEKPHRKIPEMLGDLNTLIGTGMIARLALEHCCFQVDQELPEHRNDHDPERKPEMPHGHLSVDQTLYDNSDRSDAECGENGFYDTQDDGQIQLVPVFFIAEIKEHFQRLKHCFHPPLQRYAPATFCGTVHLTKAILPACRMPPLCPH